MVPLFVDHADTMRSFFLRSSGDLIIMSGDVPDSAIIGASSSNYNFWVDLVIAFTVAILVFFIGRVLE